MAGLKDKTHRKNEKQAHYKEFVFKFVAYLKTLAIYPDDHTKPKEACEALMTVADNIFQNKDAIALWVHGNILYADTCQFDDSDSVVARFIAEFKKRNIRYIQFLKGFSENDVRVLASIFRCAPDEFDKDNTPETILHNAHVAKIVLLEYFFDISQKTTEEKNLSVEELKTSYETRLFLKNALKKRMQQSLLDSDASSVIEQVFNNETILQGCSQLNDTIVRLHTTSTTAEIDAGELYFSILEELAKVYGNKGPLDSKHITAVFGEVLRLLNERLEESFEICRQAGHMELLKEVSRSLHSAEDAFAFLARGYYEEQVAMNDDLVDVIKTMFPAGKISKQTATTQTSSAIDERSDIFDTELTEALDLAAQLTEKVKEERLEIALEETGRYFLQVLFDIVSKNGDDGFLKVGQEKIAQFIEGSTGNFVLEDVYAGLQALGNGEAYDAFLKQMYTSKDILRKLVDGGNPETFANLTTAIERFPDDVSERFVDVLLETPDFFKIAEIKPFLLENKDLIMNILQKRYGGVVEKNEVVDSQFFRLAEIFEPQDAFELLSGFVDAADVDVRRKALRLISESANAEKLYYILQFRNDSDLVIRKQVMWNLRGSQDEKALLFLKETLDKTAATSDRLEEAEYALSILKTIKSDEVPVFLKEMLRTLRFAFIGPKAKLKKSIKTTLREIARKSTKKTKTDSGT